MTEHYGAPLDPQGMLTTSIENLIVLARMEGLQVMASEDDERVRMVGPAGLISRWTPFVAARKAELLQELLYGICDGCGREPGRRLTQTSWTNVVGQHESLCAECMALCTEEFDRNDWPEVRWSVADAVLEL